MLKVIESKSKVTSYQCKSSIFRPFPRSTSRNVAKEAARVSSGFAWAYLQKWLEMCPFSVHVRRACVHAAFTPRPELYLDIKVSIVIENPGVQQLILPVIHKGQGSRMIKVTVKVAVKVTCCDSLGVMQARFRSRGSFFLSKLTLLSSSYGNSAFPGAGPWPCWAKVALLGWPGDICTSSSCSYVLELRPNSSTAPPAKTHHHHAPNPLQKSS